MSMMGTGRTLLCIHKNPVQLDFLQSNGYSLVTAANGREGLSLLRSRHVDAVVLQYYLGLLDGTVVASEIRHVRPEVPIIMLAEQEQLLADDLKSVDAIVPTRDGPEVLLATVYFVLNVHKRIKNRRMSASTTPARTLFRETPFPPEIWDSIRDGSIRF